MYLKNHFSVQIFLISSVVFPVWKHERIWSLFEGFVENRWSLVQLDTIIPQTFIQTSPPRWIIKILIQRTIYFQCLIIALFSIALLLKCCTLSFFQQLLCSLKGVFCQKRANWEKEHSSFRERHYLSQPFNLRKRFIRVPEEFLVFWLNEWPQGIRFILGYTVRDLFDLSELRKTSFHCCLFFMICCVSSHSDNMQPLAEICYLAQRDILEL